jgi:hypothetical protein
MQVKHDRTRFELRLEDAVNSKGMVSQRVKEAQRPLPNHPQPAEVLEWGVDDCHNVGDFVLYPDQLVS